MTASNSTLSLASRSSNAWLRSRAPSAIVIGLGQRGPLVHRAASTSSHRRASRFRPPVCLVGHSVRMSRMNDAFAAETLARLRARLPLEVFEAVVVLMQYLIVMIELIFVDPKVSIKLLDDGIESGTDARFHSVQTGVHGVEAGVHSVEAGVHGRKPAVRPALKSY